MSNLECTADTEDTVVGLLRRKTLDGLLDVLRLLGNQVIEPIQPVSMWFNPTLSRAISEEPGTLGKFDMTAIAFKRDATIQ